MTGRVRLAAAVVGLAALALVPGAFATTGSPFSANDPDLGTINVGNTSSATTVTITNGDTADHIIDTLAVTGPDAGQFGLTNNTCSGSTLTASGGSCTVGVTFSPTGANGARSAQIDVNYDGATTPATEVDVSNLSGTANVPTPAVSVPATLDFGGVKAGTTQSRTLTVQNTGTAALHVTTVGKSGSAAITVPQANNSCRNSTVAAGSSCTMTVNLTPTKALAYNAVITINDDAGSGSQQVTVTGALLSNYVTLSTAAFTSTIVVGHSSAVHTVTVTNLSSNPVTVSSLAVSGKNPRAFALGNNQCTGQAMAANGGTCTFTVQYNATAAGTQTATIVETDDAPDATHGLPLTAKGAHPPPVTGLRAVSSCTAVALTWNKPNYKGLVSSRVIRNVKRIPRTPTDGTLVSHPSGHLTNTGLKRLTTYHYAVWATYRFKAGGPLYYSVRVAVSPHLGRICTPGNNSRIANHTPTITWSRYAGAWGYGMYIYNHGRAIDGWARRNTTPHWKVPSSWTFKGVHRSLQSGQSYTIFLYAYTNAHRKGILIASSGFHVN